MPVIKLDAHTVSHIAAGEVVESPTSVIKELLENALDAGAKRIKVKLEKGGLEEITVIDDGCGILGSELRLALERHATSKITAIEDLARITTLGFRGEALPSISAVSRMEIITCHENENIGSHICLEGGVEKAFKTAGFPRGTMVVVKDLFYNVPVRRRFLQSTAVESGKATRIVKQIALSHPHISFNLERDGKTVLETPGDGSILNSIMQIYGHKLADHLLPLKWQEGDYLMEGFVSAPTFFMKNRSHQIFFVNRRYIHSQLFRDALEQSYRRFVTAGKHPLSIIFLYLPPHEIDVNVHPAKIEVRFQQERSLVDFIFRGITKAYTFGTDVHNILVSRNRATEEINAKSSTFDREVSPFTFTFFHSIQNETPAYARERTDSEYGINIFPASQGGQIPYQLLGKEIVGQIFSSYIVLQERESLILVDQHAAHERVLWEEWIQRQAGEKKYLQVTLPFPLEFNIPLTEDIYFEEKLGLLAKLGLELEQFGNNSYIIRTVPFFLKEISSVELLDIFYGLCWNVNLSAQKWQEAIMLQLICKASIKANKSLSIKEMEELLRRLDSCKNPSYCPHGRPIIIQIKRNTIEKMFHRI